MPVICPAILANNKEQYSAQVEKIAPFAHRMQIDLTDGMFAKNKTVEPSDAWWPVGVKADIHLMYKNPLVAAQTVLRHQPNLVIIHAEAEGDFNVVARACEDHNVKIGLALLPGTPVSSIVSVLDTLDHVLIFSGDLGNYGGHANLSLLDKVKELKDRKPSLEVGWDGGANSYNISQLVFGGVDVINVGGFLQKADDPAKAYSALRRIAEETGTT